MKLVTKQQIPENPENVKTYFKNLYSNKLENLKEMDTIFDTQHLLKLNQNHRSYLSIPITLSDIEAIMKNFPN